MTTVLKLEFIYILCVPQISSVRIIQFAGRTVKWKTTCAPTDCRKFPICFAIIFQNSILLKIVSHKGWPQAIKEMTELLWKALETQEQSVISNHVFFSSFSKLSSVLHDLKCSRISSRCIWRPVYQPHLRCEHILSRLCPPFPAVFFSRIFHVCLEIIVLQVRIWTLRMSRYFHYRSPKTPPGGSWSDAGHG